MNFWLGPTDNNWFKFLAQRELDEVNFWIPSEKPLLNSAPVGLPFLFKLKSPFNHVAGGGFFVGYSTLPLSLAWDVFGVKNGASTYDEFRSLIGHHLKGNRIDPVIGCIILTNAFFLKRDDWFENPPGWSSPIVRGKMYDTATIEGAKIWDKMAEHFLAPADRSYFAAQQEIQTLDDGEKYGEPVLVKPRLGQSAFRMLVTEAYNRRCAITGENTLVVLDAAHIVPYSNEGTHEVSNGLLLRSDFHKLFDNGLVSVTPEYKIKISPRIRESYFNGKAYYRLDNETLSVVPISKSMRPDRDRLEWHFKNVFQG